MSSALDLMIEPVDSATASAGHPSARVPRTNTPRIAHAFSRPELGVAQ